MCSIFSIHSGKVTPKIVRTTLNDRESYFVHLKNTSGKIFSALSPSGYSIVIRK